MSSNTVIKLKPKSAFHLGTVKGENDTTLTAHSDTIFSGIVNCYRSLYGNEALEALLERYKTRPPFKLSSSYPYYKDKLFYPFPMNIDLSEYTSFEKEFKKVKYLSQGLLEKYLYNSLTSEDFDKENIIHQEYLVDKKLGKSITGNGEFIKKREVPHVTLDRENNQSQIYYMNETVFKPDTGLFFLLRIYDKSIENKVKASIRLLGDKGLGGNRSNGRGLFTPSFSELNIQTENKLPYTLSLVFPDKQDLENFNGYYRLIRRGGWIYSPDEVNTRKKTVRVFSEGSVFKEKIRGKLVDVTPPGFTAHKVYRYGLGFYLDEEGDMA